MSQESGVSVSAFLKCAQCSEDVDINERMACGRCRLIFTTLYPLYVPQNLTNGCVDRGYASVSELHRLMVGGFLMTYAYKGLPLPEFVVTSEDAKILKAMFPEFSLQLKECTSDDVARRYLYQVVDMVMHAVYACRMAPVDLHMTELGQKAGFLAVTQHAPMETVAEFMARYGYETVKGTLMRSHMCAQYGRDQDITVFGSYTVHYRIANITEKTVDYIFFSPRRTRPYVEVERENAQAVERARLEERQLVELERAKVLVVLPDDDGCVSRSVEQVDETGSISASSVSSISTGRGSCVYKIRMVIVPDANGDLSTVIIDPVLRSSVSFLPERPEVDNELDAEKIYLLESHVSYMYWAERFDVQLLGMCILSSSYLHKPLPHAPGVTITRYRSVSTRQNAIKNWLASSRARVGGKVFAGTLAYVIPSGEGKTTLCLHYPGVFVDHDDLIDKSELERLKSNEPVNWLQVNAFLRDVQVPQGKVLLTWSRHTCPDDTEFCGALLLDAETGIRANIQNRESLVSEGHVNMFASYGDRDRYLFADIKGRFGNDFVMDNGLCYNKLVENEEVIHAVPFDFLGFLRVMSHGQFKLSDRKFDIVYDNGCDYYHIDYGSQYSASEVLFILSSLQF